MRTTRYDLDPFFSRRFSPTEFEARALEDGELEALIEAASTAPSCFNEQPWRFVLADHQVLSGLLAPANQAWAQHAARLVLLCCDEHFVRNGKTNQYAAFDSGTAWGYLGMEAFRRGILVHAMAGFDTERAAEVLGLGALKPLAMIALGYSKQGHTMTPRKGLDEVIIRK